jgi:hypothetical protein
MPNIRKDEPGCLRFDVVADRDDPQRFYFYEVYRDEAALAYPGGPNQILRGKNSALAGSAAGTALWRRSDPSDGAWR